MEEHEWKAAMAGGKVLHMQGGDKLNRYYICPNQTRQIVGVIYKEETLAVRGEQTGQGEPREEEEEEEEQPRQNSHPC